MSFGENILKYQEDILTDLKKLVSIDSYKRNGENGDQKPKEALNFILKRAEEMGFKTVNVDNIAGHAEYGDAHEIAGVLTHVDVVPASDGWDTDPFELTLKDGKLYGRGVADDKGSAIISLYCLKALKDFNIVGKRRLRTIFGAAEETGMDDMEAYFKSQELPQIAFTPDSDYGICNVEKGILQLELVFDNDKSNIVKEFHSGTVVNAVPDKATALLNCDDKKEELLSKLIEESDADFSLEKKDNGLLITAKGMAAHAAQLEKGINAAVLLIKLLKDAFKNESLGNSLEFINNEISLELHGESIGIYNSDAESGSLTLNVGRVDIEKNSSSIKLDIRYPVSSSEESIVEILKNKASEYSLNLTVLSKHEPLYLKEDQEIISILKNAYKAVTKEEAELYYTGGGTYARTLKGRGVAFGPVFPGEEAHLHDRNENLAFDKFMLHAQICLEAMYRMITE